MTYVSTVYTFHFRNMTEAYYLFFICIMNENVLKILHKYTRKLMEVCIYKKYRMNGSII
jgi:hypothetical protein